MALASPHTFTAGELLTAANLQNIETNILNNPISLISPTTGVINFNSQAHTNFVLQNVATTQTAATTGLIWFNTSKSQVEVDDGTNIRYVPTISSVTSGDLIIGSSSRTWKRLAVGSTGQILTVSSSNTDPVWGVIPPDGGLSTGTLSTGNLYYISTEGKYVRLAIGTSGQVLVASTGGLPTWAAVPSSASGSAASGNINVTSSSPLSIAEDFYNVLGTAASGTNFVGGVGMPSYVGYTQTSGTPAFVNVTSNPTGVAKLNAPGTVVADMGIGGVFQYIHDPTFTVIFAPGSTQAGVGRAGFAGSTGTNADCLGSTNALSNDTVHFEVITTAGGSSGLVNAVARVGGVETKVTTTLAFTLDAASMPWGIGQLVFTSSGTFATVKTNGVTAGTFTSSQLPLSTMKSEIGFGSSVTVGQMHVDAWQVVLASRPTTIRL